MFNRFSKVSRFTVQGDRVMDFMNAIRSTPIVCSWLRCKRGIYYGKVYTKDLACLHSMAKECGITLTETSRRGLLNVLSRYKKRYGILVGVLVCSAMWIVWSNVVVTITVRGNSTIQEETILSCLEDCGLVKGAYIPNLDFKSCEYALRLNLENVGWASIRHDKGRVVVTIDEMETAPDMLHDNLPCNLVSKVSARIVSVRVLNGQLTTHIGDGVTAGELLVSGIVKNDVGSVRYVHAMGEVIGEYEQSITLVQPLSEEVVSKGESRVYRELDVFNLKLPLYVGTKDTSNCHVTTNEEYFTLFGNSIPIGVVTTTVEAYTSTTQSYSEKQAKGILEDRRNTYEVNFLKDVEVIDSVETFSVNEGSVSLTITYTLQGDICQVGDVYLN